MNTFFGKVKEISNNYVKPNKMVYGDEITVITNNVKSIKGKPVMVVGNNEAVYLRFCDIAGVSVKDENGEYIGESFAVKINRKFFKTYTFRNGFDGFSFEKTETFDDLAETAKEQEKSGSSYRLFKIVIGQNEIRKF